MKIFRLEEFEDWLVKKPAKIQALVESRIFRIERYDQFGDTKLLDRRLAELRWRNGLRIYFARIGIRTVLLLHGGEKNGQKGDIKKARLFLERYDHS